MTAASDYSYAGLQNLWIKNGGPAEWAPTMAAIALAAESGGNPTATNPSSGAEGIWQILSSAQSAAFNKAHPPASMSDPNANARAAIALLAGGPGISNWSADSIGASIVANGSQPLTPQQAQQYATQGAPTNATLDSSVTPPAPAASSTDTAMVPETTFAPPMKGVDVKNFMGSGIDLSAIPANEMGNAEADVKKYITDPGYAQQLQQRISQDYGYQDSWAQKIPELNGVLIWAASNLDLSTAAGKNQFQSAVANTSWWKTTDANQRSWEQVQSSDPAQAAQALNVAQDKVLATANQIGVQLTKQQLSSIANTYAAQTFVQSGSFGSQSGTSQEWLDQHVEDAVTAVKNGTSDLMSQGVTATSPGSLTGIAAQLYENFQQVAQQYLMYSPGGKGLLSQDDLMKQVNSALASYTGTGASGQISQFETGALNQFTEQMKQQASQMYPSLAESINQGVAPSNYVTPIQNVISNTLGLDASSIDFTSPTWNWAIATPDPKTGVKTALTPDQVLQKITNPSFTYTGANGQPQSYANSNNAVQMANQFGQSFAAAFGKGA